MAKLYKALNPIKLGASLGSDIHFLFSDNKDMCVSTTLTMELSALTYSINTCSPPLSYLIRLSLASHVTTCTFYPDVW